MTHPRTAAITVLDTAGLTAYGFSARKDLLAQLLALNQQVAGGSSISFTNPVTAGAHFFRAVQLP